MISLDLQSGCYHIDICADHQTFLGFAWKFSGVTKFTYFVFAVLPFGLASAPFISKFCLETLEKYWRIHGISVALFLDDDQLIDSDQAPVQRQLCVSDLIYEKSVLLPLTISPIGLLVRLLSGYVQYGTLFTDLFEFRVDACLVLRTELKECPKNVLWCLLENQHPSWVSLFPPVQCQGTFPELLPDIILQDWDSKFSLDQ